MDLPVKTDDALGQPTRARLFDLLGELKRPAGTQELAERLDLHPNGVRLHLERMREAGLVVRERSKQARGRPRDMWLIAPDASPGGDPPTAYADLGRWLARAIEPGDTTLERLERTGRQIGRTLAPDGGSASTEEKLRASFVALGFQPHRCDSGDGELAYRLCDCPYRDAVSERQEVVCMLHRGLTHGLLDELAPGAELTGFVPRDPYEAGCLVKVRGVRSAESEPPAGE